ncbi:MAG: ribosome recycling factor [Patescibacteria group bacterium]
MNSNLSEAQQKMQKAMQSLSSDLSTVRTGRAAPSLVENIVVSVYGGSTRLKVLELATIGAQDPQTLVITPFDGSIIEEIRKGIMEANVGLNPVVDGPLIRISIPPLSQERREELIHLMKQKLEAGRIMIRQIRHEAMADIKKANLPEDETSRLEKEVQGMTDKFIGEIDALGRKKEDDLLQI